MVNTREKLKEWARWSSTFDCGTGFKPIWESIEKYAPVQEHEAQKRKASKPIIMDDEAMMTDKAMSMLSHSHPMMAGILRKFYLRRNTLEEIARYYVTPIEHPEPEQMNMDWDDVNKKKVNTKRMRLMFKVAHDLFEVELFNLEEQLLRKYMYSSVTRE